MVVCAGHHAGQHEARGHRQANAPRAMDRRRGAPHRAQSEDSSEVAQPARIQPIHHRRHQAGSDRSMMAEV